MLRRLARPSTPAHMGQWVRERRVSDPLHYPPRCPDARSLRLDISSIRTVADAVPAPHLGPPGAWLTPLTVVGVRAAIFLALAEADADGAPFITPCRTTVCT